VQSRRDQLHAYRFLTRRAVSAVVTGDPDVPESPMRRITVTTISGVLIAIVVAAGAFVVGLMKPGSTNAWKEPGTIIVEQETGARYVLFSDRLRPTINYPSAVLALGGGAPPRIAVVARKKLASVPRDPQIGIGGLPDSLPSKSGLITSGWTVCSQQQTAVKGESRVLVSLFVGGSSDIRPTNREAAAYVKTVSDAKPYLLWHGRRFAVTSNEVVSNLGLSGKPPVFVAGGFLNALAQGPDLAPPALAGAGSSGPVVGRAPTKIGQVLSSGQDRYYLVTSGKALAPISQFVAALAATLGRNGGDQDSHQVSDTDASALATDTFDQARELPLKMPELDASVLTSGGICVDFGKDASDPVLAVPSVPANGLDANAKLTESDESKRGSADRVVIPPGKAAVIAPKRAAVAPTPGPGASESAAPPTTTAFIVAEPGKKFAIAPSLLAGFGYSTDAEFKLPDNVILLVPTGPAMDPVAARSTPS
jgi:type VII secretion protein EccB